ncbi:iron ABC transporter permease [Pseudomonas sp.]|uniref:FecCD family ABC transporter permease n=1 Tax=Pseudomonas sp. TaxID=306 RepID=UPI00289691DB|nr:iron ABC transporter permease [Pseudomonas sp.]
MKVSASPRLGVPLIACCLTLLVILLTSLLLGAGEVSVLRSINVLLGGGDDEARFVVLELRGARMLLGLLVGMALGVGGAVLQTATRNPLAEPGLLGVSAGASFAMVVAIALGASAATVNLGMAITGAMLGCLLVVAVTQVRGFGADPVRLILAGMALTGILGAASTLLLLYDQRTADEIRFWVIGALAGRPADTLSWALPGTLAGLLVVAPLVRPLAALSLGERMAIGLGHHPQLTRLIALLGVAILVGTATAVAGPIGFVGLVVPFLARRMVGPDVRRVLPLSLVLGPAVLLLADILSRLLVKPYELPIGVVTAFIGAPILMIVVRQHRLPSL